MYKIIPMLTDPTSNGLLGFRSFDVIVPSLPGFGFSRAPVRPGTSSRAVASLWHTLMAELGHSTYFAQGGDIGSGVSTWLARLYPNAVRALHLNFISGGYQRVAKSFSVFESIKSFLRRARGRYNKEHS
jgi:pimeloyl-ACP methyl ester carboxylesterase